MDRLRSSGDIRHVMTAGSRAGTQAVVVYVANPRKPLQGENVSHHRVAVVAGRRIGNAVVRNRAKRRIRAIAQSVIQPDLFEPQAPASPLDMVIVAKPDITTTPHHQLTVDIRQALTRAHRRLTARHSE